MTVTEISSSPEFYNIISGEQIVFIHFWAGWSAPCRAIKPIYDKLSVYHDSVAKFYSVDIDKHEEVIDDVSIINVPTIIAFKGGEVIGRAIGGGALPAFVAEHAPRAAIDSDL